MSKTFADAIFEAEQHTKQIPKFEALRGMVGADLRLVYETLNSYRVFNVKAYPQPTVFAKVDPSYDEFFELLDNLHDRKYTGNAARELITRTLSNYTERTAKALARVLNKDLRCGATITTFKKLYPNLVIPTFELMGAEKMAPKYVWLFPCIGSSKYDGSRLIAMVQTVESSNSQSLLIDDPKPKRIVTYWSRQGNEIPEFAGIFDEDLLKMADAKGYDLVVDGEALASSFKETSKAKGSKNQEAKDNLKFYAFDMMSLSDWDNQVCLIPQLERTTILTKLIESLNLTKVVNSKFKILNNLPEAKDMLTEVLEEGLTDGVSNGLGEGLIIKHIDGLYCWNLNNGKRGPEWTKWKTIIDVDLQIVGFYAGAPGTRNENKLGGLILEGSDENGNKIKSNVGGFKVSHPKMKPFLNELAKKQGVQFDDPKQPNYVKNKDQFLREYIWHHQWEFYGKMAMFEAQELCIAEGATEYALRFGQFITMRPDKD